MGRYPFTVRLFHPLLPAGFDRRFVWPQESRLPRSLPHFFSSAINDPYLTRLSFNDGRQTLGEVADPVILSHPCGFPKRFHSLRRPKFEKLLHGYTSFPFRGNRDVLGRHETRLLNDAILPRLRQVCKYPICSAHDRNAFTEVVSLYELKGNYRRTLMIKKTP